EADRIMAAEITIACCVGYGQALPPPPPPVAKYGNDYFDGYGEAIGGRIDVLPDELRYASLDGAYVLDDDGVDLFNLTPDTIIKQLTVSNGPIAQKFIINDGAKKNGDPVGALKSAPTQVNLQLVPVA